MFKRRRCPCRFLSSGSKRGTFGTRYGYSLFRFLIPTCRTRCMCPAIFCFEDPRCCIKREPIAKWGQCSICFWMNFVHHDVDVEVRSVIVRDNHILMVLVAEYTQSVQSTDGPLLSRRHLFRRPAEFIVAYRIITSPILFRCCLHHVGGSIEVQQIVGKKYVPSQSGYASLWIALSGHVLRKTAKTTSACTRSF